MLLNLLPHPAMPPAEPAFKIWANLDHASSLGAVATTNIWFGIGAPAARFAIPPAVEPARTDCLWESTCFEAFLRRDGEQSYCEWNFAPSGQWAAYQFQSHREDKANAEVRSQPYVRVEDNFTWWALGATIAVDAETSWQLGLSAVIEERDGTKSYWALAHPLEDKPDFHHPDCFVARLP